MGGAGSMARLAIPRLRGIARIQLKDLGVDGVRPIRRFLAMAALANLPPDIGSFAHVSRTG